MTADDLAQILKDGKQPILYVLHTSEQVYVTDYSLICYEDRDEYYAELKIKFMSKNPCKLALRKVKASEISASIPIVNLYAGHPVQQYPAYVEYTATVTLDQLSTVPFGTTAAEVLFGKK